MEQPPSLPPTGSHAPKKKGIPAIGWVGIGCGGLLLLGIVAVGVVIFMAADKMKEFAANPEKAAAERIVRFDPDLEMVSQDDTKGEMKIRMRDGEEVTVSYKDLSEGKIPTKDADGHLIPLGSEDLTVVPAWVPRAHDLTDGVSISHEVANGTVTGQFTGKTNDTSDALEEFLTEEAANLGMNSSSTNTTSLNEIATTEMKFSGGGKSLVVMILEKSDEPAVVTTSYTEK